MLIYVVRHGETTANQEGRLQGWSDDPLSEAGVRLAELTGQALKGVRFDACFASPLQRARITAELLLRESGNGEVPITLEDRLKEVNMGEWEGKRFRPGEREVDEEALRMFFDSPAHFSAFPGGESLGQLCDRTQDFLKELARKDGEGNVLVVTHGCALRAMLNFLYPDPNDFWHGRVPYNCAMNLLKAEAGALSFVQEETILYDASLAVDRYAVH